VLFSISLGNHIVQNSDESTGLTAGVASTLTGAFVETNKDLASNCQAVLGLTHSSFTGLMTPTLHSLLLICLLLILLTTISLPLGMILGYRSYKVASGIYYPLRFLGAIPDFVMAIALFLTCYFVFDGAVNLHAFSQDEYGRLPLYHILVNPAMAKDYLTHAWLPLLTLLISNGALGNASHAVKEKCRTVLNEEFITVARARGIPESLILCKHTLKIVLTDYFSFLGSRIPHIIGSLIVVEFFFARPGLGQILLSYVKDLPEGVSGVFAITLVIALLSALLSAFFQILVAVADPRWTNR